MREEICISGACLEGLGIPNGGIAVVDREKVYENACAGCTRHGEKPGECYHDEPCERLISAFTVAEPVDAVEMKHGRWIGIADDYADGELVYDIWECSECGFDADGADEKPNWNYCPHCGAKMDLEETQRDVEG